MEEKKPTIKNARLRGLITAIGSAVLAGIFLIVSAIIYNKGKNNYRSGEALGLLFFCFVAAILGVINGVLLMIFGDKKAASPNTQNPTEKPTKSETETNNNINNNTTNNEKFKNKKNK